MDGDPVQSRHLPDGAPTGRPARPPRLEPALGDRAELPADGSAWEYPTYENAETFVARLARRGLVVHDDAVDRAVHGLAASGSVRSVQRHFQKATGLSYRTARQIERARHATGLLRDGASILDTVHRAGYYDQAHLTRSLTHYIGQTPGDIVKARQQLSFLYKTSRTGDS